MELLPSILLLSVIGYVDCFLQSKRIQLDGNGYTGVTVAISSKLDPTEIHIQRLKNLITAASAQLYKSTKYHVFFKDVTIVIPKSWPNNFTKEFVSGPQLDTAHIIVDKPNPLVDNKPYVSGMTGCGHPGRYIHLEPITVQVHPTVGLADKILVHHWGHFRWGLFDEHGDKEAPIMEANRNPWFYSTEGTFKPNICARNIKGQNHLKYCQSSKPCLLDDNGLPEKDCKFCVEEQDNTVKGSIMGKPEISSVVEFCDDENSDVPHNREADTPHNRFCQGRSAWEIMRLHSDFKDTKPGSPSQNTVPTFRVVQQRAGQKVVLVLDKSGSMNSYDQRINKLKAISSNYIRNWSPNATSIAVVTFNETASVVAPLTTVTSEQDRQGLVTLVKNIKAHGATSIGAGLQKALELLTEDSDNITGSEIILVSDGANTVLPGPDEVREEILAEGVIIRSVAIGREADAKIDKLAKDSGGFSFFYSGNQRSTALADIFLGIAASSSDEEGKMYQLESKSVNVTKDQNYTTSITIDSTIGLDTTILLMGPGIDFTIATLSGPGNSFVTSGACTDSCSLKIDGIAEVGDYVIEISSTLDVILTLTAHSYPRNPSEDVLTATAWTSTDSFDFSPSSPIVLYALVQKGIYPVFDAEVKIFAEDENGHVIHVDLADDGLGMDLIKGDGQYTGLILPSEIKSSGRHSLKLVVTGKDGESKILLPELKRRKRQIQNEIATSNLKTENVGGFKRVAAGGTFTVQNYKPVTEDKMPPARITTLRLMSTEGNSFNVSWNAVGDDFTVGKASSYMVFLSNNYSAILSSTDTVTQITDKIPTPSNPGNLEIFSFVLPEVGVNYYLAVLAVDDEGNQGEVSNIVSVSVVNDNSWKRVESTKVTSSQSISMEGLFLSASAAAIFVFILVSCGCFICKKRFESGSKANDFNYHKEDLSNKMSHERYFGHDFLVRMYYSPHLHFVRGYQARDPRIHGYRDSSYLYYIS
ncbi:calcium-activated chloride channel regulator 1-like [Saccostrea cucullata]|uniref:calcium-activated chloride channel regulator 1-like n=1 Tax=Saccostrea cuccullata TaxID=36930 RepID=UPI002ED4EABB